MPYGDNDGSVDRTVLFQAPKNHGMFVSADKIKEITKRKDITKEYVNEKMKNNKKSQPSQSDQYSTPVTRSQTSSLPNFQSFSSAVKGFKGKNEKKGRKNEIESVGNDYHGHQVNTRVVYFTESNRKDDQEIRGTLKFLGYLRKHDDTIFAVVETVLAVLL